MRTAITLIVYIALIVFVSLPVWLVSSVIGFCKSVIAGGAMKIAVAIVACIMLTIFLFLPVWLLRPRFDSVKVLELVSNACECVAKTGPK